MVQPLDHQMAFHAHLSIFMPDALLGYSLFLWLLPLPVKLHICENLSQSLCCAVSGATFCLVTVQMGDL